LSYLVSAAFFALAVTTAAHPDFGGALVAGTREIGGFLDRQLRQSVQRTARWADAVFRNGQGDFAAVTIAIAPPGPDAVHTAMADDRFSDPDFSASATVTILPDLAVPAPVRPRPVRPRAAPPLAIPQPPPVMPAPQIKASARAIAVAQRLEESLTPEMLKSFGLFVYVSKADHGPLAQRMYVFRKQKDAHLKLLYDWPASTGRERQEISPRGRSSFTGTPRGYYELDPGRMYRRYTSYSWKQSMPYAMFFNWERRGLQTGLAIHAATGGDIALLGRRASAGCVHLAPQDARTLYELIRGEYRGRVPRFAYDARTRTMSNDGTLMHDAEGRLKLADGYRVLVQIEDYPGDDSIAALF
jgi:lipoprotein-anchoring transpeptidase ErfK/SrfK